MRKTILISRYIVCLIVSLFLFFSPTADVLSNEADKLPEEVKIQKNNGEIKTFDTEKELKLKAKTVYDEAVSLYKDRNYEQALTKFKQVSQIFPHYLDIDYYLRTIPKNIQKEKEFEFRKQVQAIYEDAFYLYRAHEYEKAQAKFKQVAQMSPHYSSVDYFLHNTSKKIQREKELKLKKDAQATYDEAVSLYKAGKYEQAQAKFKQTAKIIPHYQDTDSYLGLISQYTQIEQKKQEPIVQETTAIEQELKAQEEEQAREKQEQERQRQREAEAEEKERQLNKQAQTIYNEALSLYRAKNYEQAKAKFEEVAKLIPNYSRTDNYLSRIDLEIRKQQELKQKEEERAREKQEQERKRKREAEVKEEERQLNEQVRETYNEAVSLYRAKNYEQAKAKFEEVVKLIPNYSRTESYLTRIDREIERQQELKQKEEEQTREKQEQERKRQREAEVKERARRLNEQARATYNEALSLYRAKNYVQAKVKFGQVNKLIPNYSRTENYLESIDLEIRKQQELKEKEQEGAREKQKQERQRQHEAEAKEKERQLNEQAREIYNEAVSLYRAKKFEQAQGKFAQVAEMLPNYSRTNSYLNRISEDIKKEKERRLKEQAESKYKYAYSLYKNKKHQQALEKFKELEGVCPDYKSTRTYIRRISGEIEEAKIDYLIDKANTLYDRAKYQEAEEIYRQVIALEPNNRTALNHLQLIPQKIQEQKTEQLKLKAQTVYEQAYYLYRNGKYKNALEKFKEVRNILPNYEKTEYYIERTSEYIQKEKEQMQAEQKRKEETARSEKVNSLYNEAVSLYRAKNYEQAKVKFDQVNKLIPNYSSTENYLARIDRDIQKQQELKEKEEELARERQEQKQQEKLEAEAKERKRLLNEQVRATYNEAVSLYRAGKLEQAKGKFDQVNKLVPNYSSTENYLARIGRDIRKQQELKAKEKGLAREKQEQQEKREAEAKEKAKKQQQRLGRAQIRKINSLYKKAVSLQSQGELYEARVYFLEILSIDPTNKEALDYIKNTPQ